MQPNTCTSAVVFLLTLLVRSQSVRLDAEETRSRWMEDWFDVESYPPVEEILTERQQFWFHSLGYAGAFNKRPSSMQGGRKNVDNTWEPNCVRKEYRALTEEERIRYHDALNAMKTTMIDDLSEYDIFVTYHRFTNAPAAHGGAAFFPWHREFLFRMERSLQAHDPDVCLPYWDSTLDSYLEDAASSALWTEDYVGNPNGTVDIGPFSGWEVIAGCRDEYQQLTRFVGLLEKGETFTDEKLEYIWAKETYESMVCYVDCYFEDNHGWIHTLVAGHMESTSCSPSDPIFYMHHSFMDFIWEEFRQHSQVTDPEFEYPYHVFNETNIGGQRHDPDAAMQPFAFLFNINGLSNHYINYYYRYAPRPLTCEEDSECESAILWCDVTESDGRCKAKVMEGGNCAGLPDQACVCSSEDSDPVCEDETCLCY